MPNRVKDMEFDEVSLVDVPANQHARILITKAAGTQEATVADEDLEIEEVDLEDLQVGDVVLDDDDNPIEITEEMIAEINSAGEQVEEVEEELEPVGKSYVETVRESLAKALGGSVDREGLSKVAEQIEALAKRAHDAEEIAKRERDTRLEREYIEKAAGYGLPVDPEELGPVMKRAAESLSYEDAHYLHKVFETAGRASAQAFAEIGKGVGSNADPFGIIEGLTGGASSHISKAEEMDKVIKAFEDDDDLYRQYEAHQRDLRGGF